MPFNNDETIHIHNMFPMCQCRKEASEHPNRLVTDRWGLGDVRHGEIGSVSPCLIDSLHVHLYTPPARGFRPRGVDRAIPSLSAPKRRELNMYSRLETKPLTGRQPTGSGRSDGMEISGELGDGLVQANSCGCDS